MKRKQMEFRAENLKGLAEQRAELCAEMEQIVGGAKAEERALSEEEQKKFEELEKKIKAIDATIRAEERVRDLSIQDGMKKKEDEGEEKDREKAEERAFENYIRGVVSEERAGDVNMTSGDNGALIPTSIVNKIIKKVHDICPIYQLATLYNIGGTVNIPSYDDTSQSITMAYATEFTDLESTSGKFTSIELKGFLAGALTKVSKSLVNNSQFDIVSFVVSAMADAISRWIEKELLNGTNEKVEGLSGVSKTVDSAASTAVTADELIDLQEAVPDMFQGPAVWIMNKATRTAIRKLKDNDGNYILNKDATARWGYTLFGKDVYTSDNMSEMAAGKTAIYYGDMSGLAVKLSEDVNIEILREKFATQHAIGVVGWIEIDSKVENKQKIAKLVMKKAA